MFILSIINQWKNKGQLPKNINIKRGVPLERNILTIYKNYQERLKILNSCDFGDLILHCATMFENNPDILELYSKISNIFLSMNTKIQITFKINGLTY